MPPQTDLKARIQTALAQFAGGDLKTNTLELFAALGYRSNKQLGLSEPTAQGFHVELGDDTFSETKARVDEWQTVDLVLQLTETELNQAAQRSLFDARAVDLDNYHSYLIFCLELKPRQYSRTELAGITREINKMVQMSALVLFKHGSTLTLAVIDRRLGKRDPSKNVLEKVTLIKDIRFASPHRAHIEILFDLALPTLIEQYHPQNFSAFHDAWRATLDTSELNKKFFRELANWFYWAKKHVTFPDGAGQDAEERNARALIRLLTRLIFVWFIKEKEWVPEVLFDETRVQALLKDGAADKSSSYYQAVLQNLFFATLNTPMSRDERDSREFRSEKQRGWTDDYLVPNKYRYAALLNDPDAFLQICANIPFLNGGLFQSLDRELEQEELNDADLLALATKEGKQTVLRVDGFSERPDNSLRVPNFLFFSNERKVDLNKDFDTKNKEYPVRGLIRILNRYKFTVDENTPIEQEIALDPELLGKVFENLLAAYNPETGVTARKQTGSFYTPREIVNYMVDESLIAHLSENLRGLGNLEGLDTRLRNLLSYGTDAPDFDDAEKRALVNAIDDMKILDPACGSGAFPMGVLHKLVHILGKLDPKNQLWKEKQVATAKKLEPAEVRESTLRQIEESFAREEDTNYARKLYLIQNCIFGVDIQPIAVQIAKLRCFISLVVDERTREDEPNRGVLPLPNLETKFVAANSLIGIDRPQEPDKPASETPVSPEIRAKYDELADVLRQYLKVRNPATQRKYLELGEELVADINTALKDRPDFTRLNANWIFTTATSADALLDKLPGAKRAESGSNLSLRRDDIKAKEEELEQVRRANFSARTYQKKKKNRKEDAKLRRELATLLEKDGMGDTTAKQLAAWDPYDQNASADFFDAEWMFGVTDGFDVMIGNPPYLIAAGRDYRKYLTKNYTLVQYQTDFYVFFIELALRLAKKSALVAYIVSDSWLNSQNFSKLRNHLLSNNRLRSISVFDFPVFENASMENSILILTNQGEPKEIPIIRFSDPNHFTEVNRIDPKSAIARGMIDPHQSSEVLAILEKIEFRSARLESYVRMNRGIHAYRTDGYGQSKFGKGSQTKRDKESESYHADKPINKTYLPELKGRDVFRFFFTPTGKYISYGIWLAEPREPEFFHKPKLTLRKILGERLHGTFIEEPYALDQSLYVMISRNNSIDELKYFLGILLSGIGAWYLRTKYAIYDELYPWYTKKQLADFPIKKKEEKKIASLVDRILAAKHADPEADTTALERKIDELVYQLYGLTEEEIKIVEGKP